MPVIIDEFETKIKEISEILNINNREIVDYPADGSNLHLQVDKL